MSNLRAGLIGFGNIAQQHYAGFQKADGAEVVAVVDNVPERLERAQADGAAVFSSAEQMFQETQVDLVSLCTPPSTHAPLAELAFRHGAHVFCEKPLAHTVEDGRRMIVAAREAERLLGVAFCHRFIPAIRRLRELVHGGKVGRPLLYRNQFSGPFEGVEYTWFADPDVSGGGTLMDTTVHSVDLFRYIVGEIDQVRALTNKSRPEFRVEDTSAMLVRSTAGCLGVLEASWSVAPGTLMIEVRCEHGEILYDYQALKVRGAIGDWQEEDVPVDINVRFDAEIQHFVDAVLGKHPLELTAEEGQRTMVLIEQAYTDSAR